MSAEHSLDGNGCWGEQLEIKGKTFAGAYNSRTALLNWMYVFVARESNKDQGIKDHGPNGCEELPTYYRL